MTEESNSPSVAVPDSLAQSVSLRQAREAAGLEMAALAAMLKVPVERLLALEEGRYQDLPDLTFARALASSVCRVLKIDPAPVLQGLPQPADVKLYQHSIQTAVPMPHRLTLPRGMPVPSLRAPWIWATLLLLLALALWWWLPQRESAAPLESQAAPEQQGAGVVVEPPAPAARAVPPAATEPPAPAAQPAPAPAPAAQPAPVPAASAAAPVAVTPLQPDSAQPLLQLRARETTWIQLKDAGGKELQQKLLHRGQTLDYGGQGPVQVVLGRVTGIDVIVRGQPFDTSSFPVNRVARFEVK